MSLPYWVVDAFTTRVFTGNPAAVVLCDAMPVTAQMQAIAAENNLSETAFATIKEEGDQDWDLRWFTPTVEVDLCGHATLATAFVLANQGHPGPYRFHTRSGVLGATAQDNRITLDFPARHFKPTTPIPGLAEALGAEPLEILQSADPIAVLDNPATVRNLRPDFAKIRALPGGAIIVTAQGDSEPGGTADITSRYFAPGYGIDEDPVTGSLHTQVVPFWADRLGKLDLLCRQASKRGGKMRCHLRGDRIDLTGTAVLYARGEIYG